MINEVLYMEVRLFRQFCEKYRMNAKKAYEIFKENSIWQYIESCYDVLHMNGDEYILNDITAILKKRGVVI